MEGNSTITCLPNGTWSNYPICHGMMTIFHVQAKRIKEKEENGLIDLVKCSEQVVKEISFWGRYLYFSLSFFLFFIKLTSGVSHFLFHH